ncbi:hypothetical protein ACONUD_18920 [Microbulbifer harenosus]|uniref:DUF4252 domain-containing protein n=1 Tax=Microbulbifer harenosus TaxID=2576840 RepID=A0ABY2UE65_9GAMM|nr:hypothetical protein [Microbulbifer harenosus]TLM75247.1 hypothetical protein FDY93_16275 [Microbulbifer harenosus]
MFKKFIFALAFTSSFALAVDETVYQRTVNNLNRGETKILYRVAEFPQGMSQIFNKYVDKMDPMNRGIAEFGEFFDTGDILSEKPNLRLVFAFSSNESGAILVQHGGGGISAYVNVIIFETTEDWYCRVNLGRDLSYLDTLRVESVLRDRIKQGESPHCEE